MVIKYAFTYLNPSMRWRLGLRDEYVIYVMMFGRRAL